MTPSIEQITTRLSRLAALTAGNKPDERTELRFDAAGLTVRVSLLGGAYSAEETVSWRRVLTSDHAVEVVHECARDAVFRARHEANLREHQARFGASTQQGEDCEWRTLVLSPPQSPLAVIHSWWRRLAG
jgi:hypothetical protein